MRTSVAISHLCLLYSLLERCRRRRRVATTVGMFRLACVTRASSHHQAHTRCAPALVCSGGPPCKHAHEGTVPARWQDHLAPGMTLRLRRSTNQPFLPHPLHTTRGRERVPTAATTTRLLVMKALITRAHTAHGILPRATPGHITLERITRRRTILARITPPLTVATGVRRHSKSQLSLIPIETTTGKGNVTVVVGVIGRRRLLSSFRRSPCALREPYTRA